MNIQKRIKISMFINGFGGDVEKLESLDDGAERVQYLLEKFGKSGLDIYQARQIALEEPLPLGWLSRVINFFIRVVDWSA